MTPRFDALRPYLWSLLLFGAAAACNRGDVEDRGPVFQVPGLVQLPRLEGWSAEQLPPAGAEAAPVLLRLVRESAVPGSPRVTVVAEPPGGRSTVPEEYLTRNLRDMGQLEASGQIRIIDVEQQRRTVGGLSGFRVRHEYTLGSGTAQIAITQISIFLVSRGRGITVSAAGRTELFHPLAKSIDTMLAGLRPLPAPSVGVLDRLRGVDLGRIGGRKK